MFFVYVLVYPLHVYKGKTMVPVLVFLLLHQSLADQGVKALSQFVWQTKEKLNFLLKCKQNVIKICFYVVVFILLSSVCISISNYYVNLTGSYGNISDGRDVSACKMIPGNGYDCVFFCEPSYDTWFNESSACLNASVNQVINSAIAFRYDIYTCKYLEKTFLLSCHVKDMVSLYTLSEQKQSHHLVLTKCYKSVFAAGQV